MGVSSNIRLIKEEGFVSIVATKLREGQLVLLLPLVTTALMRGALSAS